MGEGPLARRGRREVRRADSGRAGGSRVGLDGSKRVWVTYKIWALD